MPKVIDPVAELAEGKISVIHLLWHKTLMTNVAFSYAPDAHYRGMDYMRGHYRGMDYMRGQQSASLAMRASCSSCPTAASLCQPAARVWLWQKRDSAHRYREKTAAFLFQTAVLRLPGACPTGPLRAHPSE